MFVRRSLFPALAVLLLASPALADSIPVPDFDFSNPIAVGLATPSTSAGLGSWQVPPPSPGFLYYEETAGSQTSDQATTNWYNQMGVFDNSPAYHYVTGLSESQVGYIFDTPSLSLSQTLSSTFQAGQSYQLTVGLGGGGQGVAMPLEDPIQIGLFYMSGGSQTLIGTTTVLNDNSNWNGSYINQLTNYSVSIPTVGAGDPWAGQNIGVALIEPDGAYGTGSYWDVGNVQLEAVPEPGTIGLLAAAGFSFFVLTRRRLLAKQSAVALE